MDLSELLKKENLYKVGAVVLVLVFVFEMFAMGQLSGNTNTGAGNNQTNATVEGNVVVNATVLRYQPYIITAVHNATLALEIGAIPGVEELVENAQGYVVALESAENMTQVYAQMEALNVSGRANAIIGLPPLIGVPYNGGIENISTGQIEIKLEPVFETGENITISIFVRAEDKKLSEYGSVTVLPSLVELRRNATVVSLVDTRTAITVPWEQRHALDSEIAAAKAKYGNLSVSYIVRDYVTGVVPQPKPAYVTLVAGDTIYMGNYSDRAQVAEDVQNASFPDSLLTVSAKSDEFGGFARNYTYRYNVRVVENGQPLYAALLSPNEYEANQTVELIVSAYAIKNQIVSVSGVRDAD